MLEKIRQFIEIELWNIDLSEKGKFQGFFIRQLRIIVIAGKGFLQNNIQEKASALTYYTLLSIVPTIALIFGVAKGFGFEEKLKTDILSNADSNKEVWENVVVFAESMLDNTRGGLIAGIGIVVLLWSVMKLLNSIEEAFNNIWEIRQGRSLTRKLADYMAIMIFAPVLLILSSSVTVFIRSQVDTLTEQFALIGFFGPLLHFLFTLSPYILMWASFTLLYTIMPNTRVKVGSAFIAGVLAGSSFQFFEWLYISLQFGVSKYNAIYGSFAALPLFLIWLQTSWLIVLVGAELSFANQNVDNYQFESSSEEMSVTTVKIITVLVIKRIIQQFLSGGTPLSSDELSKETEIPVRLVRQALFRLTQAGLIAETPTDDDKTMAYLPLRDINTIRIADINQSIEDRGTKFVTENKALLNPVLEKLNAMRNLVLESKHNVLIRDLV
jgi:membrane protein